MEINQLIEILDCAATKVRLEKTQVSGKPGTKERTIMRLEQPIRSHAGVRWEEQMESEAGRDAFRY